MDQPAQSIDADDCAITPAQGGSGLRRLVRKTTVRSLFVVVAQVLSEDSLCVALPEDQQVVQALSPRRGREAVATQQRADRRHRDRNVELAQLTLDAAIPPARVLMCEAQDERGCLAALLHLAGHAQRPTVDPVSLETLEGAIDIGRYLLVHAKAAFVVMGADKAVADAKHILRWIERNAKTEFSERDAYRTMTTRFKHPPDLHPGLTALESRGYIRRVPEAAGKRPGRKASPRWEVNPDVHRQN